MKVRSINLSFAGSVFATSFTDTFNRADTANGLGPNYLAMSRTPLQSSVLNVPSLRIVSGQMVAFANGAGVGSVTPGTAYLVVPLLNTAVYGKSQYAELIYSSSAFGGDVDICPAVMLTGSFANNDQNGYMFDWDSVAGNLRLLRYDVANNVLATTPYVAASLDVWRIEVTCGATSNTLALKVNGVTLISYVDAAGPLQTGYPCLWAFANVPVNLRTFNRFRAGIL